MPLSCLMLGVQDLAGDTWVKQPTATTSPGSPVGHFPRSGRTAPSVRGQCPEAVPREHPNHYDTHTCNCEVCPQAPEELEKYFLWTCLWLTLGRADHDATLRSIVFWLRSSYMTGSKVLLGSLGSRALQVFLFFLG